MPTTAKGVDLQHLDPTLSGSLAQLIAAVEAQGHKVTYTSGFRTYEQQAALKASGNGGVPVAAPGSSRHESGLAADVSSDPAGMALLHSLAGQYGLNFPLQKSDPFHVQLVDGQNPQGIPTSTQGPQAPKTLDLPSRMAVFASMIHPEGVRTETDNPVNTDKPVDTNNPVNLQADQPLQSDTAPDAPPEQTMATATYQGQYGDIINAAASKYGVDPRLIAAVIRQESGGRANATSGAGAQGLMQLMPATARSLGVTDPNDPSQNIDAGVRYLKQQLNSFGGDISKALAAYNAGPGAVQKYGGVPPYSQTQAYVKNILSMYGGQQ